MIPNAMLYFVNALRRVSWRSVQITIIGVNRCLQSQGIKPVFTAIVCSNCREAPLVYSIIDPIYLLSIMP